MVLVQK